MPDEKDDSALKLKVGTKGAEISVPERVMRVIAPDRWARLALNEGLVESIKAKRKSGEALTTEEQAFDLSLYDQSGKRYLRQIKTEELAAKMYPEVDEQMKALPPHKEGAKTSGTFLERWREDVGLVADGDEIRDIYARILAGEAARPGSFSMSTLGVLRNLDKETGEAFSRAAKFVVDAAGFPFSPSRPKDSEEFYNAFGFTHRDRLSLSEAGLITLEPSELRRPIMEFNGKKIAVIPIGPWIVVLTQKGSRVPGLEIIPLTTAGYELYTIVHKEPSQALIRAIGAFQPELVVEWGNAREVGTQMSADLKLRPWQEAVAPTEQ